MISIPLFSDLRKPNRRTLFSRSLLVTRAIIAWRIFSERLIQILLSSAHDLATHRCPVIGGMSATRSSDWRSLSLRVVPSSLQASIIRYYTV